MDIQVALDLATSIAVFIAIVTFVIEQHQNRNLSEKQYAIDKLDDFLGFLKASAKEFADLGNSLRRTAVVRESEIEADPEIANKMLDQHFLEVILFVEGVQRELQSQIRTYFPVFFKGSVPHGIGQFDDELTKVLNVLRSPSRQERVPGLEIVEPVLRGLTNAFAKELQKVLVS